MAINMAVKMGEAAVRAVNTAWNGVKDVVQPDEVKTLIRALQTQLYSLRLQAKVEEANIQKADAIVAEIVKNLSFPNQH